jgi:hypothetical protein
VPWTNFGCLGQHFTLISARYIPSQIWEKFSGATELLEGFISPGRFIEVSLFARLAPKMFYIYMWEKKGVVYIELFTLVVYIGYIPIIYLTPLL